MGDGTSQLDWYSQAAVTVGARRLCSKEFPGAGVGSTVFEAEEIFSAIVDVKMYECAKWSIGSTL